MLSFASIGFNSVCSTSIVRISISIRRAMDEIGTSLEPPSNGFEEFSPTFSSDTNSQPTSAPHGTVKPADQRAERNVQPDRPGLDPGGFSQVLCGRKECKRHQRGKDHHQHDGDGIV